LETQWQNAIKSKGGADRFTLFLEAERFTEDEYRGLVANRLLRKKLRDKYFDEPITEQQINAHFESTKEQPGRGNKVRVSRILLRVEKTAHESKWQDAETRITEIHAELKSGLPFVEAVKKYSEGPYAKRDGDLGWATDRRRPFATFGPTLTMQVGEYHGPIRGKSGVELVTVTQRKNDAPGNIEQETPRIRQLLSEQRDRRNDKRLIQVLRSQYRIEILQ
jgi:peptidyl-prolyl cis-trans isomerase SurA